MIAVDSLPATSTIAFSTIHIMHSASCYVEVVVSVNFEENIMINSIGNRSEPVISLCRCSE